VGWASRRTSLKLSGQKNRNGCVKRKCHEKKGVKASRIRSTLSSVMGALKRTARRKSGIR